MKVLVVLLGLITATLQSGGAATKVRIRAYNATGELDISKNEFILGTRVLLTCDVSGLPQGGKVFSYRWYHSCTGGTQGRCQIRDRDPYYKVVNDTLLADVTAWDHGGKYSCFVTFSNKPQSSYFTPKLTVAGSPVPFLYTPTSLLPEHSVLTDVQQATGRNGQQWISCWSGGQRTRPKIWMGNELVPSNSSNNFATIGLDIHHPNGLYHCSIAGPQTLRQYFSIYLRNSTTLPTPTVSAQDTSMWTLASPDGSRVERYIVEFECSVRNITFVEKYVSISASGGIRQVATSASCFGGLGQLHRAKVWAVSGSSISRQPAGKVVNIDGPLLTLQVSTPRATQPDGGTFIGAGVGVGVLLLVLLSMAVLIIVVVVVRRKTACKQKRDGKMGDNLHYKNTVVDKQGTEMREKGLGAHYQNIDSDKGEDKGSLVDGFNLTYENADGQAQLKKESAPPPSTTSIPDVYGVVDKSKKMGAKKETEDESTVTNKDDFYAMPVKKESMVLDKEEGVVESGGVEEEEQYDDTVELKLRYEPKADSKSGQQSEGDSKAPNANMLYAVVVKSRKKKK